MRYFILSVLLITGSGLSPTVNAQMGPNRSSLEDRRYALRQEISDYEDQIRSEQSQHAETSLRILRAEAEIRDVIRLGQTRGFENSTEKQFIEMRNSSQQRICQLQSAVRRCETELRQIDQAHRYRNADPGLLVVWLRSPKEMDAKIRQELAQLKGRWVSRTSVLVINDRSLQISKKDEQEFATQEAHLWIDPTQRCMDFNLANGTVERDLYWLSMEEGRKILVIQRNLVAPAVRPQRWLPFMECGPGQVEVFQFSLK